MKVYIDNLLFINFIFDTLILLTISIILKRNVRFRKIIIGGIFASLSVLSLFISINFILLFFLKIILMFLIVVITFGYKDLKYTLSNIFYFFIVNIVYGGFLYFLNIEFSYKNIGLVFYKGKISISYLFLIIISPIILYIYTKGTLKLKNEYSLMKKVDVYLKNGKIIKLNGYLDTANKLVDPYKKRMVIITNSKKVLKNITDENILLVPYNTIDSSGLIKCILPSKVFIEDYGTKDNILIGYISKDFNINGVNCLLNGGMK
ncbi:MAG: sigma-E processing peptidase SpoIIGA [Bacilli bacterium]|nr:sigma-E processing peptidase SpoIIGA [Bacilli bacterium]